MIRNMMKTLLCLMLALMLPLAACADTQRTLTIIPGDELASIEAVKDLLDVLSFTLTTGEKSAALTVSLDGTEIATVALAADTTGIYARSGLVSDDVFYATWDEVFDSFGNVLKTSISAQATAIGEEIDESAFEAIDTMIDAYKLQVTSVFIAAEAQPSKIQTPEESLAMIKQMFGDDPGMVAFYEGIFDLMTSEEGEFADESRDTATGKISWVMTGADIAPICDSEYMRSLIESLVKSEAGSLEEEALEAKVDETLELIRKVYEESDMNISMEMFTADDGETLVGMIMGMSMSVTEDNETVEIGMNLNYDRLTGETGVSHKADMSMVVTEDDETVEIGMKFDYDRTDGKDGVIHKADFSMSAKDSVTDGEVMKAAFELVKGANGVSDGSLAVLMEDEQITFVYHGENVDDTRERTLAFYDRPNASAIVEPAASDRPIITVVVVSSEADEGRLEAIENATPETAVNVLKLSVEEMNEIINEASVRMMQAVYLGMSKLPSSVLMLIQGFGNFGVTAD